MSNAVLTPHRRIDDGASLDELRMRDIGARHIRSLSMLSMIFLILSQSKDAGSLCSRIRRYAPGGGVGIAALAASSSMSAFLDGLPISVLGRLVRNSKSFGISIGESLSLRKARSSASPTA